jgi:hypothetical protein
MSVYKDNDETQDQIHSYNTFAEDRVLRVRVQRHNKKDQKCYFCKVIIIKDAGSAYFTGLSGGQFYNYHVCLKCYQANEQHKSDILLG